MAHPTRKSPRLAGFDYSTVGAYFITLCTRDRKRFLSIVEGGGDLDAPTLTLTRYGKIVEDNIVRMTAIYPHIAVEKYVIMPNHVHLLVHITASPCGPSGSPAPPNAMLPRYVGTLKRFCNKQCGQTMWQRSYDDRVIRNESMYRRVWEYIDTNPIRWQLDRYYT